MCVGRRGMTKKMHASAGLDKDVFSGEVGGFTWEDKGTVEGYGSIYM